MIRQQKFHLSISEAGNLQLRIITEYQDDAGKVFDKKYSDAVTPANTKDMTGWDDRSKAVVEAITDPKVVADFKIETQNNIIDHGNGLVGTIKYDRVIDEDGKIAVRRITRIFDEGEEVSKKYHRSWIMPGDDYSKADVMSRALAGKLHSVEVIKAYKAKIAEIEAENVAEK